MALTVNTNVASLQAQRNLERSSNELNTSFQRLSSGLRINGAKDDAAGLAITNRFTSEIRGLAVAERNANDGISLSQTAEGAMAEVTEMLQRMRELAVQSSNNTNTASDRSKIQTEVAELIAEIDRVSTTTNFNGANLLDGSFGTSKVQVGTKAGQTISLTIGSTKSSDLGATTATQSGEYKLAKKTSTGTTLSSTGVTSGALATLGTGQLTINGTAIRAADSGDDTKSSSDNAASALARAAAINASSSTTGVHASADATTVALGAVTTGVGTVAANDFLINGTSISLTDTALIASILTDINGSSATTGVVASGSAGGLTLTAVDGRNIQLESSGDDDQSLFANFDLTTTLDKTIAGTVTLYSNDDIVIAGTNPDVVGTGLGAQTINADSARVLQTDAGAATFEDLSTGDLIINGYSVDMAAITATAATERSSIDATASAMNIALQINNTTGLKSEVVADAQTVMNLGKISAADADGTFTLIINGSTVTIDQAILADDSNGYLQAEINAVMNSGSTTDDINGIVASVNSDGELLLTADDGRNINVDVGQANATDFLGNFDATNTATDKVAKGSITLSGVGTFSVTSIEGDKQSLAGIVSTLGTVASVDVSTFDGAQAAITAIDSALDEIDTQRATLGAGISRLESSISNMQNMSENLSAARSRTRDADFTKETASLTKNQILQQAAISVLAQANAAPQQVLALLQ